MAQQEVDDARTEAESAQAALDEARKDREDAVVRAEISGRVGRTRLEVGARVTGPSDLLTTVEQLDPVYVSFRPSSQDLLRWRGDTAAARLIRPGSDLRVHVVLPDGTELPRTGKLDYVSPSLDPATGTQEFRATFANRDLLLVPGPVRPGAAGGVRPAGCARDPAARGAAVAGASVRAGRVQGRHRPEPRRHAGSLERRALDHREAGSLRATG